MTTSAPLPTPRNLAIDPETMGNRTSSKANPKRDIQKIKLKKDKIPPLKRNNTRLEAKSKNRVRKN